MEVHPVNTISVIVATYGDPNWETIAQRALASVHAQTVAPLETFHIHGDTLATARNRGAELANGDWLLFLDADDELDHSYIEAMTAAAEQHATATPGPVLLQPATLCVVDGREDPYPAVIPERPLSQGNYMVIGTLVDRELFHSVGGFLEWELYEDWCLWIRCWQNGARSVPVPEAIYRAHVSPGSRNMPDRNTQVRVYNQIRKKHRLG